tara:strand:- start:384 stop:1337 length:954 start_codon:yes stop_codon:yes gene_type:complete
MFTIKQPSQILFGKNSAFSFDFPQKPLLITSPGAKIRNWISYLNLDSPLVFDQVEPNPSIETAEKIIKNFENSDFSIIIGLGGGSVLDVTKFVASKLKKFKILIPTTFGSGSEVTRISVLKVNGNKKSFHNDNFFADIAIIDSYFIENSPIEIIKNSAIDALAQCSEGYDSKLANVYTKFLCEHAFNFLEDGILNMNKNRIVLGSLYSGLGFGNCSTTLGHALSYVYSNEGFSHGHALAYTTLIAHKYNNSKFYERFKKLVNYFSFPKIHVSKKFDECADLILTDKKHIDNNPKLILKNDIIDLMNEIEKTNLEKIS